MAATGEGWVLRSRRVVTPDDVSPHDICIENGKIEAVLPYGEASGFEKIEDAGEQVVMPGLVDSHVHINEPGRTDWEGFVTATQAAAVGGITTLVDMPLNCIPVTTSAPALQQKLVSVSGKLWVDCGFWGGVVPGNAPALRPLIEAGVLGVKCFLIHSGIDDFANVTESDLRKAMPLIAAGGIPLLVHAELDLSGKSGNLAVENPREYETYLASRPPQWELDAIALMIRLCRETGCPVHIVHLSCADALPMLQAARREGLPMTVETCSHYLALSAEGIPAGDTRYKCAPPIRERENSDRLWQGLENGTIDFIISDHSPCTPELKLLDQGDFHGAWGGIASLQLGLSVIWSEARKRGYSLNHLARWMCENPSKLVGLHQRKGRIAPGLDADIVIWNPEEVFTVTPEMIRHRHKITPYTGKVLHGVVSQTILRGYPIYNRGELAAEPVGMPLLRRVPAISGGHP